MSKGQSKFSKVMAQVNRQRPSILVVSSFVNLLLLVTSIYMLQIYDRVLASGSLDTLVWLTIVALVAIAAYGVLEHSRRLILARSSGFIDAELSAPVLNRSMEKRLAGQAPEASIRDVSDLRNYYRGDAAMAFYDAPWSIVFIAFVWLLHPVLGQIVLAGAIVLFSATLLNDVLTRARQKEAAASVREANEAAIRFVEGGETIAPLGMAQAIFGRWKAWQDRARNEQQELGEKTTAILSFTKSLRLGLQVSILGAGAYFVLGGELTAGAMIAASIVASRALAPIERLTAAWRTHLAARSARSALATMFAGLDDDAETVELPRPSGRLSVETATVLAPVSNKPLLQGVDFALEPGQACALIGPSGAGKSSLCRAIVGAWAPAAGSVRLDGAETHSWNAEKLGKYIGYLPQKVELFPGTVAENIGRFGDADNAAVIEAARMADAEELILRLPDGYDTDVGRDAEHISLGQRQRIGLARALYGRPSLVVLDEPNSNLDADGDRALIQAIERLKAQGSTVVIVSHRSGVLKAVDKVLVLKDGMMSRFCDRKDLLKPVAQQTSAPAPGDAVAKKPKLNLRRVVTQPAAE